MFKEIYRNYKGFEKITNKILRYGLTFCFFLCLLSVLILFLYNLFFHAPLIYYIGIYLFKLSLIFGIEFIICSFVVDGIKKQQI